MRRLIQIWLGLLVLVAGPAPAQQVVRVVTWNLQWFPGGKPNASPEDREEHIRQVAQELAKIRPDVILLQEVSDAVAMDRLTQHSHFPHGFTTHVMSTFKDGFSGARGQHPGSLRFLHRQCEILVSNLSSSAQQATLSPSECHIHLSPFQTPLPSQRHCRDDYG